MPLLMSGEYVKSTKFSGTDVSRNFMTAELTTTGILPMMYAAMKLGEEIETNIVNLLQFHFITLSQWIFSSLLYFLIVSFVPIVFNIVADMILIPDTFFASQIQLLNIFYFVVESIEGVVTGMLIALILRKGRNSSMTAFFILVFTLCFSILSMGSKVFTIIISIFIPCYTI